MEETPLQPTRGLPGLKSRLKYLAEVDKQYALGEKSADVPNLAGDLQLKGNVLLEAGKYDEAKQAFERGLKTTQDSNLSQEIKDNTKLFQHYNLTRVALGKRDLAAAKTERQEFRKGAEASKNPAQVKQAHELAGLIALEEKNYDQAIAELQQTNLQNPQNLFRLAQAYQGKGDLLEPRLLAGDYRDPLVGRDILIGAVIGVGMILINVLASVAPRWIGRPSMLVINPGSMAIDADLFFRRFAEQVSATLFQAFIALFLLLLFVVVLRRERLAPLALWVLLTTLTTLISQASWTMIPFTALWALLALFALKRYGLLAAISAIFFSHLFIFYPMTTELTAWYATDFTIALIICLALAAYGFYTSSAAKNSCPENSWRNKRHRGLELAC
jgi:hypothetical protein